MVKCDDTGAYYAYQAGIYYDVPDDDELANVCIDCSYFDACPGGCGWGMCSYYGEFKQEEQDACRQFTPREDGAAQ